MGAGRSCDDRPRSLAGRLRRGRAPSRHHRAIRAVNAYGEGPAAACSVRTPPGALGPVRAAVQPPGHNLVGTTDGNPRDIGGERVLGLPAEPRIGKDRPFTYTRRD